MQRVRFGLWGESVGLIPSHHSGRKLGYDKKLDRPDIGTLILRILKNIKSMLDAAERAGKPNSAAISHLAPSRGLEVFRQPYERLRSMLRGAKPEGSSRQATRLDIHKVDEFEILINRLRDFVDGLENPQNHGGTHKKSLHVSAEFVTPHPLDAMGRFHYTRLH